MEYSSFLLSQRGQAKEQEERGQEDEGEDSDDAATPSREGYRQGLLSALSRSRGHQQKGVLSFRSSTPASVASESIVVVKGWSSHVSGVCFVLEQHMRRAYQK